MKNVDHDVRVIGHDPLAGRESIDGHRGDAVIGLQTVAQFAGDGLQMRLGRAGADDEEIRETGNTTEVDGEDILGFFLRGIVCAEAGELFRVDGVGPGKVDDR
jgi:hypothetical protein